MPHDQGDTGAVRARVQAGRFTVPEEDLAPLVGVLATYAHWTARLDDLDLAGELDIDADPLEDW